MLLGKAVGCTIAVVKEKHSELRSRISTVTLNKKDHTDTCNLVNLVNWYEANVENTQGKNFNNFY